jgi:heme/copper-type cytochrome/quinol oxidase subunit 2
MKRLLIIIVVVLFLVSLGACEGPIAGGGITGAIVGEVSYGDVSYGDVKEERYGEDYINVKEFVVRVTKNGYGPNILQVSKGDPVRLILYPSDADHGFVLPAFGINEHLEEGNYKTLEFVADMDGKYTFFSNVYAGPNTKNIFGILVVDPVE